MLREKVKTANILLQPRHLYFGPEWLVLGVNNICNLHCKMCDVGNQNQETNFATNLVGTSPMNMPIELFHRIVDQAKRFYPKVKLGYAFTEPLIYPHLEASLAYANEQGMFTTITTNALNLKQKAEMLCTNALNELYISLDGPEKIHNHIRGHKSSFQRAISGIEELLNASKRPEIAIFCVITQWNIGHLVEMLTFFKDYPLKQFGFMHMNFTPQHIADQHNLVYGNSYPATDSNVDEIDVAAMNLPLLLEEIETIQGMKMPFPVTFSPSLNNPEALDTFYNQPEKLLGKRCNDVFSNIMIKSDGSVIPAHGRCYNLSIGNLYEDNLNRIWNSAKFGQFRKTLVAAGGLLPACSRCCSAF
jgi:MoaA/NifB/PqqE/SkfB family radical SAM enzyme